MKKLSIIIPVWNDIRVVQALNSIYNDPAIEIIVVDGQSTDGTVELIKKMINQIDVFISEKDSGFYDAVNKGIKCASSEWIFVLAADDILIVNPLNILEKYTVEEPDIICGDIIEKISENKYRINISHDDLERLRYDCSLRHPASFFRKSLYDKIGLYDADYKCAGDREFFLRAYLANSKIRVVDDLIVLFEFGGMSTAKPFKYIWGEDIRISRAYKSNLIKVLKISLLRTMQPFVHVLKDVLHVQHHLTIYSLNDVKQIIDNNKI